MQDLTLPAADWTDGPALSPGDGSALTLPVVRPPARVTYSHPGQSRLRRGLIRTVEVLSGQPALERMYRDWAASPLADTEPVFAAALRLLGLDLRIAQRDRLAQLPSSGGLLIVANHPFGIVDGLVLGHLGRTLRDRVGIMTNSLLCQVPEVEPHLLPVDFSGTAAARRLTAATRQRAVELLARGGAVVIFPAGGVATANAPLKGRALDAPWHPFVAKLATGPGVTTLPVHFSGQNSRLFQIASHTSYPLRVALIFHETRRRRDRPVDLALAEPIRAEALAGLDRQAVTDLLRRRTMDLATPALPDPDEVFVWPARIRW